MVLLHQASTSGSPALDQFGAIAQTLHRLGFHPTPLKGKKPALPRKWQRPGSNSDIAQWSTRYASANTGILTGAVVAVDIDIINSDEADEAQEICFNILGHSDFIRFGQAPKRMLFYRTDTPQRKLIAGKVEIMGQGQQVAVYGMHPDTRQSYWWPHRDILSVSSIHDLPLITETQIAAVHQALLKQQNLSTPLPPLSSSSSPLTALEQALGEMPEGAPAPSNIVPSRASIHSRHPEVGSRNTTIFALARAAAPGCESDDELLTRMLTENEGFSTPLPLSEVKSSVGSAWRYRSEGRLMLPGKQAVVLALDQESVRKLARTPYAGMLLWVLKATRKNQPFEVPQQATGKDLKWSPSTVKAALDKLIKEGHLHDAGTAPAKPPHKGARLYRFG